MSEMTRTLTFAGVAAALLAAAALSAWIPGSGGRSSAFEEQGEPFFPQFAEAVAKDPLAARVLEIVEYDADTASVKPFQVQFADGVWTIPSHHDYPAKAQDRLARLAGAVASMKKDTIRSDRADDHEALGVVDPLDAKATSLRGRGTHVTLRDKPGGKVLADFIVGGEVPGRPGMRYVRQAGKNRTYGVNLSLDLSTEFANWIDTDLLNVPTFDVVSIEYDTRKVDPEQMTIIPGDPIVLTKQQPPAGSPSGTQATWKMDGLAEGQKVNTTKVEDAIRAVDSLRVLGVRPLPQSSSNDALIRSMASKGFYLTRQGELLSNEGSIKLSTNAGLVYTLRFGEVTFASGDALTSGTGEDKKMAGEDLVKKSEDPSTKDQTTKKGETESRFVIVTVAFDPSLIPVETKPADALPDDVFAREADDPVRVEAEKKAKEEADRLVQERERKIKEGEKKVDELNERFKNWYYVVPGADFRRVFVGREGFLGTDAPSPSAATPASGLPSGLSPNLDLPGLRPPGSN